MLETTMTVDEATSSATASMPWWKGAVIYQIYPRSFLDTNGDGIGDLKGVHDGLDHIASLGVDGVWISPFFTSPMADYGYDVADFCGVDPIFGSIEDFDRVVSKAHELGLKVIIDQVYSHSSDQHPWFSESRSSRSGPKADWYVWEDPKPDGSPPNNWQSVFGGPSWEWDARRGQYYFHNFLKEQPDLNLHNIEVQDAVISAARFWLERGVDGFRLDALNFSMHDRSLRDNPPSGVTAEEATRPFDMQKQTYSMSQPETVHFIERFRAMLDEYPDVFTVAEVGGPNPIGEMKAFTDGDQRLNSAYSFDFLYAPDLTAERVKNAIGQWTQDANEGWPSWAFSNHDAPRALSRWAQPEHHDEMARLYIMLLLSLRGNPILYQGEELGLPQAQVPFEHLRDPEAIANWPKTLGRDGARTPFPWDATQPAAGFSSSEPWLPVDPVHAGMALSAQTEDHSFVNFTRMALNKRKENAALKAGSMRLLETENANVLAFDRTHNNARSLAIFNLGNRPAHLTASLDLSGELILSSKDEPLDLAGQTIPSRCGIWIAAG
ncbi:MAG: alpha glucosidase [Henriciella sp.]|nr:alpha glucosidase [Henriciella sp.]